MIRLSMFLVCAALLCSCAATPPPNRAATTSPTYAGSTMYRVQAVRVYGDSMRLNQLTQTTNGAFVYVELAITNFDNQATRFHPDDLTIQDSAGRAYSPVGSMNAYVPGDRRCVSELLQPDIPITCGFVYEIARDSADLTLELIPLDQIGAAAYIPLLK